MVYIKRGLNKISVDYGLNDIYSYYKINSKKPVSYKEFRTIWKDLASIIMNLIIFKNLDFSLPARLGTLCIRKTKPKITIKDDGTIWKNNLSVNYKACWDKWIEEYTDLSVHQIAKLKDKKYVYHLNEHSDGYKIKWKWDKFTATVKNQNIYSLQLTRENKQEASTAFRSHKVNYHEYNRK